MAASVQAPASPASFHTLLTDQNSVRTLLGSQNMIVLLMIFTGLGLLLAFTPCVFPMIPILTSIIVGHKQPVSLSKAFWLSLTYVLGSSLTYAAAGAMAAYMGSSLQASLQQPRIIAIPVDYLYCSPYHSLVYMICVCQNTGRTALLQ